MSEVLVLLPAAYIYHISTCVLFAAKLLLYSGWIVNISQERLIMSLYVVFHLKGFSCLLVKKQSFFC